ncbi:MAG: hypothetical protein VCD00_13730 [Candidatus Hydrogenedentota bacterium]
MTYTIDQELPVYTVKAFNYATESSNEIHSDEVAGKFGYHGGLVPGVGVYAYMTVPIVKALGEEWLTRGSMSGKFINPVYDGETVSVHAKVINTDHLRFTVSAFNEAGQLCGIGEASLPDEHADEIHIYDYPLAHTPMENERLPADIAQISEDHVLGTLEFNYNAGDFEGESGKFLEDMRDSQELYVGADGLMHPALLPHQANQILVRNVALGPWIHTASDVRHHALPNPGELLSLRGKIAHAYEKRGHDIAVMDLALLGDEERLITHLTHTAIIRPAFIKEEQQT